jgi:hypothetical protein
MRRGLSGNEEVEAAVLIMSSNGLQVHKNEQAQEYRLRRLILPKNPEDELGT